MPASSATPTHGATRYLALLLAVLLLSLPGCSGCRQETPAERAAREAAEKVEQEQREAERKQREREDKPPFEIGRPLTKPSETGETADGISRVKPGHWMTADQAMLARYEDWAGEVQLTTVDGRGNPIGIDRTPFALASSRPVRLAKGSSRQVESLFLVPQRLTGLSVESVLRERNQGSERSRTTSGMIAMKPYEYFFLVLAKEPARYTFVKTLNAVESRFMSDDGGRGDALYYRVLLPDLTKRVPLPDNPLCWTPIAYVLWDEVNPEQIERDRRDALVDWLHWGGQLIINGPDSLKLLEDSFLSPYLPATDGGTRNFIDEDIAALNAAWAASSRAKVLKPTKPWSGIQLSLTAGGAYIPNTGELLAERRVGRGRVVVSAMQLAERDLLTWSPHYDNLFNACLLRRPPRRFRGAEYASTALDVNVLWADRELQDRRLDASLSTTLRIFARDEHTSLDATNYTTQEQEIDATPFGGPTTEVTVVDPAIAGGSGAWNDFNATSQAAREALRKAAGVQVPKSSFVVACLVVYLVVLVPLNWAFFRALNRVEYAWIAAPLIALAGTIAVIKQAQLDIGFVRAQTEIGLLELQGDHARGHLSRYTALYTSLGTAYELTYDNATTLVAPFPGDEQYQLLPGQSLRVAEVQHNTNVTLDEFRVSSATTDMVHSEEMVPLDQTIKVGKSSTGLDQILNQFDAALGSVAVIERDRESGDLRGMWIGTIDSRTSAPFKFNPLSHDPKQPLFAKERAAELARDATGRLLDLEPMFRLALDPAHLAPGERRLVARIDRVLPGVTITPAAPQVRGAALIVAHLDYGPLPPPRSDTNSPRDVVVQLEEEDELGE